MAHSGPRNIGIGHLLRYRFPITAIASIFHRISGIILFLFIPALLWVLSISLHSGRCFAYLAWVFQGGVVRFFLWLFLSALLYHLLAGVKHLFMDMGYFETMPSGKAASIVVIVVSVVLMIALGVWLW